MTAFKQESNYLRAKDALAALAAHKKELAQAVNELTRLNAAELMAALKAKNPECQHVLEQHGF